MTTKAFITTALTALGSTSVLCALSAPAAVIDWSPPATIAGDTDVSTAGTSVAAYSLNTAAVTINGVPFAAGSASLTSLGTNFTMTGFTAHYAAFGGGSSTPYANLSANYKTLLASGNYVGNLNTTPVITIQNLTFGERYAIQVWVNDSRSGRSTNTYANVYSTSGGNNVALHYNNTGAVGGVGQWTIGTFIADGPTQTFSVFGNAGSGMADTYLNALQLRDLGPATFGTGYWNGLAGDGALNYTSLSFCTNLDTEPVGTPASLTTLETLQNACYFGDVYYANSTLNAVTVNNLTVGAGGIAIGTLNFVNSVALTYTLASSDANGITGATLVNKSGDGTVILDGNNTYSGGTVINLGTVQVGNGDANGSLGSGPVTNLGTLAFNRSDSPTINNVISGSGMLAWSGPGTLTLSGVNTYTGGATLSAGTLVINNSANETLSGVISGAGALVQSGSGTLILSGANTYSGGTTNNAGCTLQLNSGGATSSAAGTGPITINGNGTLIVNMGNSTLPNAVIGDSTSTMNVNLGSGNEWLLGDLSQFSGTINVNAGTGNQQLVVGNATTFPVINANAVWNINAGAVVDFNGFQANPATVNLYGPALSAAAYGALRLDASTQSGNVILHGNSTIGNGNANGSTISGVISDAGGSYGFTKLGVNPITLTGVNTYHGATVISAGPLALSGPGSIANSSSISLANGTTFDVSAVSSGTYSLGVGQTLATSGGSATIYGSLDASSGSPLSFQYDTPNVPLTVYGGNLTLNNNPVTVTFANGTMFAAGTTVPLVYGVSGSVAGSSLTVMLPPNSSYTAGNAPTLSISGGVLYLTVNSPIITAYNPYTYSNLFIFVQGVPPAFSVTAQGAPAPAYQWYSNGVAIAGANSASYTNVQGTLPAGRLTNSCVLSSTAGFATNTWVLNVIATNGYAPYPLAILQSTNANGAIVPPVSYWRLGESDMGSGNGGRPCNDWLGGHIGIYTNVNLGQAGYSPTLDPTQTSARFGNYASVNSYASLPGINFGAPSGTAVSFSIEMWLNASTSQTFASQILSQGYYGLDDCMELAFGSSAKYRFLTRNGNGTVTSLTGAAKPDGKWHHIVGVLDETHSLQMLYIDGVLHTNIAVAANSGLYTPGNTSLIIGAGCSSPYTSYNQQANGYVNEVAIYNYALPASTITAHYNAKGTPPSVAMITSTNVDYGAPLTLAPISATGTLPLYYSWSDTNTQTVLADTPALTIPFATTDRYILVVTNLFSPASTNSVIVTAYQGAPSFASPGHNITPGSRTVYAGTPVTYSVLAYGTYPLSYQWYNAVGPIPGATGTSFTISAPQGTNTYYCVADNGIAPAATSSIATLVGIARPTSAYALTVLTSNPPPVAYWRLGESPTNSNTDGNNGVIAYDYVGGHNATYNQVNLGLPGYSTADSDAAAQFGAFAYPTSYAGEINNSANGIPNINFVAASPAFSVEAWVQANGLYTDGEGIVAKGWNNGGQQFLLEANFAGWAFTFRLGSSAVITCQSSLDPNADTNWHHLVGVCDQPNGTARLYIDGALRPETVKYNGSGQGLFDPSGATLPAVNRVSIGAVASSQTDTGYTGQLVGTIDEVALYDYALSASQIAAHYTAGTNTIVAPTISAVGSGTDLVITYTGTLLWSTNVAGPYTSVPGATSPCTIPETNAHMFFRSSFP